MYEVGAVLLEVASKICSSRPGGYEGWDAGYAGGGVTAEGGWSEGEDCGEIDEFVDSRPG